MATPDIKARIPKSAGKDEIFEIKCLIEHPMETGRRKDDAGNTIPRHIIQRFACVYNGEEVFSTDWETSVAANPMLSFHVRATESGTIELKWFDENGSIYTFSRDITVG